MSRVQHLEQCGRKRSDDYSACDKKYDLHDNDDHEAHASCIREANEAFDRCVQQIPQEHGIESAGSPALFVSLFILGYVALALTTKKPLIVA